MNRNNLAFEKHSLMRKFERHEISEEDYHLQLNDIESKIKIDIKNCLRLSKTKMEEKNKMAEEQKKKQEKEKKEKKSGPRKFSPTSNATLIAEALALKKVKNFDDLFNHIKDKKNNADPKKIKSQMSAILGHVKRQDQARWKDYVWNKEEFLLTKKE